MEEKSKDWSISELYSKSWQIVKNNKILWLFGMAAVGFSSGSSRSNISSDNFESIQKFFQNNDAGTTSEKLTQVLGASTNTFTETLKNLFFAVPMWLYVLLGLGILLLILVNIVLSIVYQAWVNGALIAGVNAGAINQKPTISQSSNDAFPAIKGLIWLNIIPSLLFFLAVAVVFGILIFAIILLPSFTKAIPIIITIIAAIGFLIIWLLITLTQIWASRRVVLDRKPATESFYSSYRMVKKKFWHMVALAIVNTMLSLVAMFIMVVPVIIVGGVAVFSFIFSKPNASLIPVLIGVGIVLFLLYMIGYTILSGILNSFKASVWTLAYNHIKGEYSE